MEKTKGDHYAYPVSDTAANLVTTGYGFPDEYLGMTKREVFAMSAMQGIAANPTYAQMEWSEIEKAELAITKADILINALNSNQ